MAEEMIKIKSKLQNERKYLQITYFIKGQYKIYIKPKLAQWKKTNNSI